MSCFCVARSPGGTSQRSPPRKRWVCVGAEGQAPKGRHRANQMCRPFEAVNDRTTCPTVSTVGYVLSSLTALAKVIRAILRSVGRTHSTDFSRTRGRFFKNAAISNRFGDLAVVGARHCLAPTVDSHSGQFNKVYALDFNEALISCEIQGLTSFTRRGFGCGGKETGEVALF
jgi:hypothetical protein